MPNIIEWVIVIELYLEGDEKREFDCQLVGCFRLCDKAPELEMGKCVDR
jgi:hypothetical protein